MKNSRRYLWILFFLGAISPIGIWLPSVFHTNTAWGEWGQSELQHILGYCPHGFNQLSDLWKSPLPDYTFIGWQNKTFGYQSIGYVCSALIGILIILGTMNILGKVLAKHGDQRSE